MLPMGWTSGPRRVMGTRVWSQRTEGPVAFVHMGFEHQLIRSVTFLVFLFPSFVANSHGWHGTNHGSFDYLPAIIEINYNPAANASKLCSQIQNVRFSISWLMYCTCVLRRHFALHRQSCSVRNFVLLCGLLFLVSVKFPCFQCTKEAANVLSFSRQMKMWWYVCSRMRESGSKNVSAHIWDGFSFYAAHWVF